MYNIYPTTYQPYFQQQPQSMLWVSNEQEAFSYPVAPNNAVALWDSSKPTVYIKQADASGKPVVKIMDYSERSVGASAPEGSNNTSYALKSDVEQILKDIEAIRGEFKSFKREQRKRAIEDDE